MANYKVTDTELTGIANAIRTKGGTSAQLQFPNGFTEAINAIPTGTTPTGTKSITANGTHDVTNFASAEVAVPNSYAAGDEGKVVSNGALVAQTSQTVTENGTYDTTLKNSVVVNVEGSGGGSDFEILTPIVSDLDSGYIARGDWDPDSSGQYRTDVYEVLSGHSYIVRLGGVVDNRFRVAAFDTNPAEGTGYIGGVPIGTDVDNPSAHAWKNVIFQPASNKYLAIGKSNQGVSGIKTYVLDVTNLGM